MAGVNVDIKWDKKEIMREVTEKIASNASVAGKYVEDVARANLLGIINPSNKKYVTYRRYLATMLTHEVTQESGAIVIGIGFTGVQMAGFYIETGSTTASAQPYLRPALNNSMDAVLKILCD